MLFRSELTELEIARVLEAHFLEPGRYRYSLSMAIQDATIDPVEDFLFNRHAGHCEYFASALVLMLRSVGIPARLVTGFKGGELSSDGTLHIQQRFAHAWVEALIDRKTWVTLDGTPAAERTASVAEVATRRSVWTDVRARVSGLWSENIVNISDFGITADHRPFFVMELLRGQTDRKSVVRERVSSEV